MLTSLTSHQKRECIFNPIFPGRKMSKYTRQFLMSLLILRFFQLFLLIYLQAHSFFPWSCHVYQWAHSRHISIILECFWYLAFLFLFVLRFALSLLILPLPSCIWSTFSIRSATILISYFILLKNFLKKLYFLSTLFPFSAWESVDEQLKTPQWLFLTIEWPEQWELQTSSQTSSQAESFSLQWITAG